jgi:hypothetical protein
MVGVKLLSIPQLFLPCIASRSRCSVTSLVDAFSLSRSVSQRPKNPTASIRAVLDRWDNLLPRRFLCDRISLGENLGLG